jgi:hypothetical protein
VLSYLSLQFLLHRENSKLHPYEYASKFGCVTLCFSLSLPLGVFSLTERRSRSDFSLQFGFGNLSFDSLLLPSSASCFHHAVFCLAINVTKTWLRIPLMVFGYSSEGKLGVHIGWLVDGSGNKPDLAKEGRPAGYWRDCGKRKESFSICTQSVSGSTAEEVLKSSGRFWRSAFSDVIVLVHCATPY